MITCTFENGNKAKIGLRHVTVGAILLNKEHTKVCLVKRSTAVIAAGKYCVPGGFMDRNENTHQAVLREVLEETGFEGKILNLLCIKDNPDREGEDRQNVDFVFIVEAGEMKKEKDFETASVEWFGIDKVPPKEKWAFDHYLNIELYRKYLANSFPLPFIGSLQ